MEEEHSKSDILEDFSENDLKALLSKEEVAFPLEPGLISHWVSNGFRVLASFKKTNDSSL